jgi:hypothetical protein
MTVPHAALVTQALSSVHGATAPLSLADSLLSIAFSAPLTTPLCRTGVKCTALLINHTLRFLLIPEPLQRTAHVAVSQKEPGQGEGGHETSR